MVSETKKQSTPKIGCIWEINRHWRPQRLKTKDENISSHINKKVPPEITTKPDHSYIKLTVLVGSQYLLNSVVIINQARVLTNIRLRDARLLVEVRKTQSTLNHNTFQTDMKEYI